MKNRKHVLAIVVAGLSLLLTSCSNLLPNMSGRRRSSKEETQESVESIQTSEKHVHEWSDYIISEEPTCTDKGDSVKHCIICGLESHKSIAALGHDWGDYTVMEEATCLNQGRQRKRCVRCGLIEDETLPRIEHTWSEWEVITPASCTENGLQRRTCTYCGDIMEEVIAAFGHDYQPVGEQGYMTGRAIIKEEKCRSCSDTRYFFKANEVTELSREHLYAIYNENDEEGLRFWGRPIGNSMELNEDGSADPNMHDPIFEDTEEGDYFEYVFDLTSEQAKTFSSCRIYCDALPASHLGSNNMDFWAYYPGATEWTQGFYTFGDYYGEAITDYRYLLFVDDNFVHFDPNIEVPVPSEENRGLFLVPYTFHFHEGTNKIKLVMSGGYRSTFYNFYIVPLEQIITGDFALEDASIEFTSNTNAWLEIHGLAVDQSISVNDLQSVVDSFDPFVQYQTIGSNWASTQLSSSDYYYKVIENNGLLYTYFYINISSIITREDYFCIFHINFKEQVLTDIRMQNDFVYTYSIIGENGANKVIELHSHPNEGSQEYAWGCLSIKVK